MADAVWLIVAKLLRQTMPTVAAFVDDLRDAFGAETINAAIKAGMDGQPTFWASEGGQEVGTRVDLSGYTVVKTSDMILSPVVETAPPAGEKGSPRARKGLGRC